MNLKSLFLKNAIIVLVIWVSILSSAHSTEVSKGQILGKLTDQSSGENLPYASILIVSVSDSSFSLGVISDIKGLFSFEEIPFGVYHLSVSFMGYEKLQLEIELNKRKQKIELALTKKSFDFSEVEVNAEKQIQEERIEKTTVNISKNTSLSGGNAMDVMQSLPAIDIDVDGKIQYRGSDRVTILLNGKRSDLVESLEQIPAEQIEKVEIINNPSAKYEADGMSGIINIVLKSGSKINKKTTVSLFAGLPETYGANVGYTGFSDKNSFYVNGGYHHKTKFQTKEHWRSNQAPGLYDYYQYDRQDELLNDVLLNTGYEYAFHPKQQIGIRLIGAKKFNSADRSINYQTWEKNGDVVYNSMKDIAITLDNYSIDGDLDYTYNFTQKGQDLKANFHYNMLDQSQKMDHVFYPDQTQESQEQQNTISDQLNKSTLFTIDYSHPFSDSILLESGYRFNSKDLLNDFSSQSYRPQEGIWQNDTALSNQFHYLQYIHAIYMNLEAQFTYFNLQLGVRGEYTHNHQFVKEKEQYFDVFPSLRMVKKLDEHFKVFVSYNRRINRPSLKMINPFTNEYADILNMHIGNPDLKPEYVNSLEAGTQYSFKKASGSVSIYYRNIDQAISRVKYASNDSAFMVTFMNLDQAQLLGSEFSFSFQPYKWWQINANANIFYTSLIGEYGPNKIDKSHYAWTGNLSQSWKLPADMGVQLSLYYRSELPDVMGTYMARYYADFAIHKKILKKKGKIIFKISDVFNDYRFGLDMTGIDENGYQYSQKNRRKNESQYFILSFIYNIQGKEKKKKKESFFLEGFGK